MKASSYIQILIGASIYQMWTHAAEYPKTAEGYCQCVMDVDKEIRENWLGTTPPDLTPEVAGGVAHHVKRMLE